MASGKHIFMVAPEPIFEPRGTPLSVVYRIRALCRAGHRVDLLTYPYGRQMRIDGLRTIRVPRLPGVAGVKIGPSVPKLFLDALLIVWMIPLLFRRRYDCIWSHEEAGLFCGVASRLVGTPHVYDMHSDLGQQIQNFAPFNKRPVVWFFRTWERLTLRLSEAVVTICDDLVDTINAIDPAKRVVLAENFCTTVDFLDDEVPSVEALRERHRVNGVPVALYIGSLEPYQGIEILLEAARYLQEQQAGCRLLIVGGREAQVVALRSEVERRRLGDVVEAVGLVPPSVVERYIELCDVLLTARSRGTNVPLKLYQYMKSGKPIVATNIYSHTQLLDEECAVLAEANGEAFGRAMSRVMQDAGLRARIVEGARRKAEAFSDAFFERQIKRVLEYACDGGGLPEVEAMAK